MRDTKTLLGAVRVKAEDQGLVEALFSRFGVIDHDGDVTEPGFFEHGAPVKISAYNHGSWGGELPVGKGTIRVEQDRAVLEGQFFLNTTAGREHFEVVKELGPLGEWSYGFTIRPGGAREGEFNGQRVRILGATPDGQAGGEVTEVSPVLAGAGIGTQTLAAKHRGDLDAQFQAAKRRQLEDIERRFEREKRRAARLFAGTDPDTLFDRHLRRFEDL